MSVLICLHSGGHTTEALSLLSALDFTRYAPRLYIIGEGDSLSERQANELENTKTRDTTVCKEMLRGSRFSINLFENSRITR